MRKVQCADVCEPSESANWGPVDDAICNCHCGVVVPRPKSPVAPRYVNWDGTPAEPNLIVEEAKSPPVSCSVVPVAETVEPKAVPAVNGAAPVPSVPHDSTPAVEAFTSQLALVRLRMANDVVVAFVVVEFPVITRLPFTVDDAEERNPARVARALVESVLKDAFPETLRFVVVAFVVVEFPVMMMLPLKVEDADTRIPSVVVGWSAPFKILQSFCPSPKRPSDDVAVAVYPPLAFPRRSWLAAMEVRPVPPYATEIVEVPTMTPFASVWRIWLVFW